MHTAKGEATIWRDGGRLWQAPSRGDRYRELMGLRCWPPPPHQAAHLPLPPPLPSRPGPPATHIRLPLSAVFSFSYFSRSRVLVTHLQFVSKQQSEETNLPFVAFFSPRFGLFIYSLKGHSKTAHIVPLNNHPAKRARRESIFLINSITYTIFETA